LTDISNHVANVLAAKSSKAREEALQHPFEDLSRHESFSNDSSTEEGGRRKSSEEIDAGAIGVQVG